MFCKCGNDESYAVKAYTTYESVLVDGCGNLYCMAPSEKHPKSGKIIAHYEPEGPFICNKCGREYNFKNGMMNKTGELRMGNWLFYLLSLIAFVCNLCAIAESRWVEATYFVVWMMYFENKIWRADNE